MSGFQNSHGVPLSKDKTMLDHKLIAFLLITKIFVIITLSAFIPKMMKNKPFVAWRSGLWFGFVLVTYFMDAYAMAVLYSNL
jgi:hypothetical protein